MILIEILKGKEVHVAHVNPDKKEAKGHPLTSSEKPANALLKLSEEIEPSLIVMGAFGHAGISYLFMGSCAKILLKTTNIPLFIYH